ncbi:hypothetical protein DSO57_1028276 [Entomophthora muscae]|uniref:Uncharacterized protein n=1 Tax=Entomophthora muscae TaxID=34485 RepID=A0ACC2S3B2_9FUNG|nr:hypothetical protein DSO57_1028276 [Entomophthora muscae]
MKAGGRGELMMGTLGMANHVGCGVWGEYVKRPSLVGVGMDISERACDRCHFSKRNCSMQLPHCVRCRNLNLVCTYDRPKLRNRKVPPGKMLPRYACPKSSLTFRLVLSHEDYTLTRLVSHHTLLRVVAGLMGLSPKGSALSQRMLWEVATIHRMMQERIARKGCNSFIQYGDVASFHVALDAYFKFINPFLPLFTPARFHARPRSRLLLLCVYAAGLARMPNTFPIWLSAMHMEIAALARAAKPSLDTLQALFIIFSSLHGVGMLQIVSDYAMYALLPMAHLLGIHRPSHNIERCAAYTTIAHYLQYNHCIMRANIYTSIDATFLGSNKFPLPTRKQMDDSEWADECCFILACRCACTMFSLVRSLIGLRHLATTGVVPRERLKFMVQQLESRGQARYRKELSELGMYQSYVVTTPRASTLFRQLTAGLHLHHRTLKMALAEFRHSIAPTLDPMPLVATCINVITMAPHLGPKPYFQGRFFSITMALLLLTKFLPLNLPAIQKALELGLRHLDPAQFPFLDPINSFQASLITRATHLKDLPFTN